VVIAPGTAAGAGIEQERLQAVESVGKAGFGRHEGFELVPEGAELGGLIGGEESEEAVGGEALTLLLVGVCGGIVGEGVSGIYLDQVVNEKHSRDAKDIDRGRRVLGEKRGHERNVPGVLGIVLLAAVRAGDERLTEDRFEFIYFQDEI